jgi:hypothetical protein
MAVDMVSVPAPREVIYRIARGPDKPFALPDWDRAEPDGTFGNRFDDPGGMFGILPEHRFRVIYCATQREAAFAEVVSRFRQRPGLNPVLAQIEDDEESLEEALGGAVDPDFLDHSLLTSDWLQRRRIRHTQIGTHGDFVDISHADSLAHLNGALAPLLTLLGIEQLDLSSITNQDPRVVTQYAARYIYHRGFSGIRYTSRLGANWECWALFEGRFHHEMGYPGFPDNIAPDDNDLVSVAKRFGITIEIMRGMGHYLRPWQGQD